MDHTKSLKHEHRLHNIVVPEFHYIRAARVVSRGRDFNTLPNRTFVPFVSVAQNVCCLSLLREMVRLSQMDRGRAIAKYKIGTYLCTYFVPNFGMGIATKFRIDPTVEM